MFLHEKFTNIKFYVYTYSTLQENTFPQTLPYQSNVMSFARTNQSLKQKYKNLSDSIIIIFIYGTWVIDILILALHHSILNAVVLYYSYTNHAVCILKYQHIYINIPLKHLIFYIQKYAQNAAGVRNP